MAGFEQYKTIQAIIVVTFILKWSSGINIENRGWEKNEGFLLNKDCSTQWY